MANVRNLNTDGTPKKGAGCIGGIIAIINSSRSNNLYNSALLANDDSLKQNLYMQSEAANKTAQTWNIISLIVGILYVIFIVILAASGVLDEVYS